VNQPVVEVWSHGHRQHWTAVTITDDSVMGKWAHNYTVDYDRPLSLPLGEVDSIRIPRRPSEAARIAIGVGAVGLLGAFLYELVYDQPTYCSEHPKSDAC
jgi:hypothetical protein